MTETFDFKDMTAEKLIKILQTVPGDTPIDIDNIGDSGFIDHKESKIRINRYETLNSIDFSIEIAAESGYHY
jgi:hypothetical protein